MADLAELYKLVRARRDELISKISELKEQTKALESDLQAVDAMLHNWNTVFGSESERNAAQPSPSRGWRGMNPPRTVVAEKVREILTERGHPVKRSDLFRQLSDRGVHIYGQDPEMVLSTMLWRMKDQFVRIPRVGYWLADKPWGLWADEKEQEE